ncbi:MAG TPA: GNAT family N-acetyltransferase [Chitinophagaceae bacterium]|nr:GNAT family N-acetyltransferase [Chitinophagaceae bacterium]
MIELVDYSRQYLDLSWAWLNDPEIKRLTVTPDFTRENQLAFFEKIPQRTDYWVKGVAYDQHPVGVVGIKHITKVDGEYWGYIGDKEYWGKGIGKFMLDQAVRKARELRLKSLYLYVADYNERAKSVYIKYGFVFENAREGLERYTLTL